MLCPGEWRCSIQGPIACNFRTHLLLVTISMNERSQLCFFYMDVMERYYTSDVSLEDGVLPGDDKFDMRYYWDTNETEEEKMETEPTNKNPILEIRRVSS